MTANVFGLGEGAVLEAQYYQVKANVNEEWHTCK